MVPASRTVTPARPLKIILDGRKLGDGGIGSHIATLLRGFQSRSDVRCTLLVRGREQLRECSLEHDDVLVVSAAPYSLQEYFSLSRRLNFDGVDLFHEPHYTLPFGLPVVTVATVHDLIHLTHPPRWFHPLLGRPLIRSALQRADAIVTVSQAVAQEIRRSFAAIQLEGRLHVVPNALPDDIATFAERVRHDSYLLAVISTAKPHKGLEELLNAFASLRRRHPKIALRVVGRGCAIGEGDGVSLLGHISRHDLLEQYRNALALVIPSRAEGFGIPMLEAKAFGVPAIIRPVPALRELVTDGDVVCTNFSTEALAAAMEKMIVQPFPRVSVAAGWFLPYRSSQVTEAMMNVYRAALGVPCDEVAIQAHRYAS